MFLIVFRADGGAYQIQGKQGDQKPPEPVPTVPEQQCNGAAINCDKQKDVHAEVKIVNPPEKDFYDKAPFWINLAIVFAALLTLLAIKRQADIMETQAKDARESNAEATRIALATAKAAQKSAEAANAQIKLMKDRERARIAVEILPLETLEFGAGDNRVNIRFSNFGYSHALNVRASGDARAVVFSKPIRLPGMPRVSFPDPYKEPAFDPLPFEFEDIGIPSVMLEGAAPVESWIGFIFPDEWGDEIGLRPYVAIEVRGEVEYEDVFGDTHVAKFSYDKRISKWGEVSQTGSTAIRHSSQWFKTIGSPDNEAT
jgi:hypothetical protein